MQYFAVIGISTDDYADQAKGMLKKANATISHSSTPVSKWKTCWAHRESP